MLAEKTLQRNAGNWNARLKFRGSSHSKPYHPPRVQQWIFFFFQCVVRCDDESTLNLIKFIAFSKHPEQFFILAQDLPQCVHYLLDLTEVCMNLDWLVAFAAELTNKNGFRKEFIYCTGSLDGAFSFRGLHMYQAPDHASFAAFHGLRPVANWDAWRASLWNMAFKFGWVNITQKGGRSHQCVSTNNLDANMAFLVLCLRITILRN